MSNANDLLGKLVLVVEDDAAIRRLVEAALGRRSLRVLTAASGEEALTLAADPEIQIDLLLTDLVMPGMSGLELAEDLRRRMPDLPVLHMSGYAENPEALAASRAGASGSLTQFIEKPFAADVLAETVLDLLASNS